MGLLLAGYVYVWRKGALDWGVNEGQRAEGKGQRAEGRGQRAEG